MRKFILALLVAAPFVCSQPWFDSGNAKKIWGRAIAATAPTDGQALVWEAASSSWTPTSVVGGTGLTSLNSQSGSTQTFSNDTNVTMVSAANVHTLTWSGALAKARQNAATVYNDAANTWSTGAQDMGSATSFKVPTSAGLAPTANGLLGYDSTANRYKFGANGSTAVMTITVASGTAALGTSSIAANTCASLVTVSAPGTLTTDRIEATPNASLSGVTGYGKASTDGLIIYRHPTTDNVNFEVCNVTGSSITPGAATLNWGVYR
jgi:hypothetical protein